MPVEAIRAAFDAFSKEELVDYCIVQIVAISGGMVISPLPEAVHIGLIGLYIGRSNVSDLLPRYSEMTKNMEDAAAKYIADRG